MRTYSLDPRVKLLMAVVGVLVTYLSKSILSEAVFIFLFIGVIYLDGNYSRALRYFIIYISQLLVFYLVLPRVSNRGLYYMLSFYSHGLRVLQPTFVPALYTFTSTPTREWVALLKKVKAPQSLITAIAVMGRFGPVVKQDYQKIKQAMSFRGLGSGFWDYIKHPLKTFEYIIVPILMQASQLADDLTISALTKGMGIAGEKTSYLELKLNLKDYLVMGLLLGVFLGFVVRGWM